MENEWKSKSFKSFQELNDSWRTYCQANFHPYRIDSSHKLDAKDAAQELIDKLVYKDITFTCVHYGAYSKQRGDNVRKCTSIKINCEFRIYIKYDAYKKELVVKSFAKEHNHSIGKDLYDMYFQNRALNDTDYDQIKELLKLKTPVNMIAKHFTENLNKPLANKV